MSSSNEFGLELLLTIYQPQFRCKEDALMTLLHWRFLLQGFRMVDDDGNPSERFCDCWNVDPEVYQMQFVKNSETYLLNAVKAGSSLIMNMFNEMTEKITSSSLSKLLVADDFQSSPNPASVYLDIGELSSNVDNYILEVPRPGAAAATRDPPTARSTSRRRTAPDGEEEPLHNPGYHGNPQQPPSNPLRVGGADLDPLNPSGGGMLMDPQGLMDIRGPGPHGQHPGNEPFPRLPPGAPRPRYDLIGPPPEPGMPTRPAPRNFGMPGFDDVP